MTTTSSAPAVPTVETPDTTTSALPIYRDDQRAEPWKVATKSVLGMTIGAVVGTVVLS